MKIKNEKKVDGARGETNNNKNGAGLYWCATDIVCVCACVDLALRKHYFDYSFNWIGASISSSRIGVKSMLQNEGHPSS